ncbi:MAG: hypothetical protein ACMVP2_01200 [Imperialibacter sp.]|uniref:hypothetical protein n=1 Tax=Imperialibacter sp. TaxID=2038411 RepID=UPI003A8766DF
MKEKKASCRERRRLGSEETLCLASSCLRGHIEEATHLRQKLRLAREPGVGTVAEPERWQPSAAGYGERG